MAGGTGDGQGPPDGNGRCEEDFVVIDRRGARESEAADHPESDAAAAGQGAAAGPDGDAESLPPPGSDFVTFVITLSTSALLYLGEIPDPDTNQPRLNLPMARHTIDILAMLREKTSGNLSPREAAVLDNFLYDLRMKFVARAGKS